MTVEVVRTCATHSVLSTAPGLVHVATPLSSSRPTVLSHSRRPSSDLCRSRTLTFASPLVAAASRVVLFNALTTVSLAQSASRFHTPHPPTDWRVHPDSE